MKFLHIVTLVFVVLKLNHVITWSWGFVLTPSFIALGFFGLIVLLALIASSIDK